MGGSKKGEHRGNARKRPGAPGSIMPDRRERHRLNQREQKRSHESPNEIMHEAARKINPAMVPPVVVERRILISRAINGVSGKAEDVTPKEALLQGMHHNLQAVYDWKELLEQIAQLEPTPENNLAVERAEREIERLYDKVKDFARDAAGFIHPKLSATHVTGLTGANQATVLVELINEVNEREISQPIPIEHKPKVG